MTRLLRATLALAMMLGLSASRAETYKFNPPNKNRPRLSFGWVEQLRSHIAACWQQPTEVTDETNVAVRIIVELNADGSLKSAPSLVQVTKHPLTKAYAETALAAIKRCAPYTFLPVEQYADGWNKFDMTFSANLAAAAELNSENEKLVRAVRERQHQPNANDSKR